MFPHYRRHYLQRPVAVSTDEHDLFDYYTAVVYYQNLFYDRHKAHHCDDFAMNLPAIPNRCAAVNVCVAVALLMLLLLMLWSFALLYRHQKLWKWLLYDDFDNDRQFYGECRRVMMLLEEIRNKNFVFLMSIFGSLCLFL